VGHQNEPEDREQPPGGDADTTGTLAVAVDENARRQKRRDDDPRQRPRDSERVGERAEGGTHCCRRLVDRGYMLYRCRSPPRTTDPIGTDGIERSTGSQ
jgi:hypothetical protein